MITLVLCLWCLCFGIVIGSLYHAPRSEPERDAPLFGTGDAPKRLSAAQCEYLRRVK